MPSVLRQNQAQRVVTCLTERWKTRLVNVQFPWLWAVRQDWNWAEQLDLNVEIIERSETFKSLLNLREIPIGELWVHYFWGDGGEGVAKVDFNGVDWNNPNVLNQAIWHSTHKLVAHIALLEEEGRRRKVTVFRTKNEWGMSQALLTMSQYTFRPHNTFSLPH